ncbi:MAG: EAL domain-containing protein [Nitrospirae bacterium]|nr:EAL domain-containing protein [Nitrospirota bacterium]
MKNKRLDFILSKNFPITIGIGIGALYWLIESGMDAFVFHQGPFFKRLLSPDANELWMRLSVLSLFLIFAVCYKTISYQRQQALETLQNSETRFSGIVEIAADAVIMVDETQRIILFNKRAERIFGYQASEVIGRPLDLLLPSRFVEPHRGHVHAFGAGTERARLMGERGCEISGRRKDGTEFPADVSISKWSRNGQTIFTAILRDITERKRSEKALQAKTGQLQAITDAMTAFLQSGNWQKASALLLRTAISQTESEYGFVGAVVEGPVLRILAHEGINWGVTVNREFYEKAVKTYQEKGFLEFANFNNLFGRVITGGKAVIANDPAIDPRSGGLPGGHPPLRHFLGVPIFKETKVVGMIGVANRPGGYTSDEQDKIEILTQAAGVLYDSYRRMQREAVLEAEYKQAEETIRRLAYYDPLTGLPNRILLHDHLQQAILAGQRENKPVALLLIDLDRFKETNDTLGHQRGDVLLQQVGSRLQGALRPSDIVARLGGDEFAVVFPLAGSGDAALVADKILKALEPPFTIEGLLVIVEASIGLALYPDHGANTESLMQRADVAMYTAKQSGSGYVIYDAKIDQYSPRRLALMAELRQAIVDDQLCLHYQPKIDLQTGRVVGTEALARWKHAEYGFIPPDQFIPPAERTGLIKPFTLWVFKTALHQCMAWHQAVSELPVSINLSTRNLHDPKLPDQLAELLQACGGRPDQVELEITESAIMADPARAMEVIKHLRAMGMGFSIDDFGAGYSSLTYLKKLPVNAIKIDKSFVINMTHDENDAVIVRSIIDLGHNLGLKVIAEGVENKEAYRRLVDLGCDAAQGYYMCRPISADEFTRWLLESPFIPPSFN